jgi:HAD superfamily hydrolase (TIGR01484 family)
MEFNNDLNVHLSLYKAEEWHVRENDYWAKREENNTKVSPKISDLNVVRESWQRDEKGAHKIMVMGDEEKVQQISTFLSDNFSDDLHLYRSKPTYLEIAHKSISKLSGIDYLLDNHFQTTRERSLAFGDNYNDLEMIANLGHGVAVGNAKDEVKAAADQIADTGKNDGVAKTLEEIFTEFL